MNVVMAPSILSADHSRLGEEIRAVEAAGADWIHIDVMDGSFVPNLTFGPPIIKAIRPLTALPFDVHLMIVQPEKSLQQYVDAGANMLTVHAEACVHLHRTLGEIREAGLQAGVSINPATPLCTIAHVLELVDVVLIMSVNPGFGGQSFLPSVLPKVARLRSQIERRRLKTRLAMDGGISNATIGQAAAAGADIFVAGSAVFASNNYRDSIREMRQKAIAAST